VTVGNADFLGWTRQKVTKALQTTYNADSYFGHAKLIIAKPVYVTANKKTLTLDIKQPKFGYQPRPRKLFCLPNLQLLGEILLSIMNF